MLLRFRTRMRDRALAGRADELGVFPERAGGIHRLARLPRGTAFFERRLVDFEVDGAFDGVDLDDVAILDQRDGPADGCLRPDMADAEAARRAGEAPVRDERDLVAHALPVERGRGGEHLAHAGAALRALVADDENLALLVV